VRLRTQRDIIRMMNRHGKLIGPAGFALGCAFLAACLSGCGDGRRPSRTPNGPGSGDEPTAEELTSLGWLSFEGGDITDAVANFQSAIATDTNHAEAYNGAGWSLANLNELPAADSAFQAAITKGLESADPHAGRAVVLRDLEPVDLLAAIMSARDALAIEARYLFIHDNSFDWRDLRLIIGQAAFELGAYDTAHDQVDSLGGIMLDETSPAFEEELLHELERLGGETL